MELIAATPMVTQPTASSRHSADTERQITEKQTSMGNPQLSFFELFEPASEFLEHSYKFWENGATIMPRMALRLAFAERIAHSQELGI